jgi:hypothetical protein
MASTQTCTFLTNFFFENLLLNKLQGYKKNGKDAIAFINTRVGSRQKRYNSLEGKIHVSSQFV